jgi:lipoate-protein ligase B
MLASLGVEMHHVDRGGEVTYHGPGQLVGYPVVDLRRLRMRPLEYVRSLERLLIETLSDFGIAAEADGRPTGIWTGGAKIAAIGVRVSRGVTTHGFALNVSPDLGYFEHIVPCGIEDCRVTSMEFEGVSTDVVEVASRLADRFEHVFGVDLELLSGIPVPPLAHRIAGCGKS